MTDSNKITNSKVPSDGYFLFVSDLLLCLSQNQKIIYVAKDAKTLEKIIFNLQFCSIDCNLTYINHYLKNDESEMNVVKLFDEKKTSQIHNASLFFDESQKVHFSEQILFSDFDTILHNPSANKIIESANIKNLKYSQIIDTLIKFGYERVSVCHNFGEFCVRGEIIDIIKPKSAIDIKMDSFYKHDKQITDIVGYRLQFFGENVEEIFAFDTGEQVRLYKYSEQDVSNINVIDSCVDGLDIEHCIASNKNTDFTILFEPFFDNQNSTLDRLKNLSNTNFIFFKV